jgi:GTP-binding protein EngB required for normal cell division
MKAALEFAFNCPTGEDDSYQGCSLAGIVFFRPPPAENPCGKFYSELRFSSGERFSVLEGGDMRSEDAAALNSSQRLHLLSSAQYADKLLSEVESILFASKAKSAFRKYKGCLSPTQVKVVEDYVARIRTQMVRALEAHGIPLPEPTFESVHSIRVTLTFVRIAFQECTADRMRGYGEVPESKVRELNGLVDEMVSAAEKLDSYLVQGLGQDLQGRLERLQHAGADVGLVKTLERIINDRGFVEFRSTLSMIIDRLEAKSFEIALFGRVSSGKSSLLNQIVQSDILPVGVNPITAVPTRIVYGAPPRLTVSFADKGPERSDTAKLPEFVSEQHNPANYKHVTRIVVELPSPRLKDGVVLVDTPGLGSLATAGAAETLAYLPRCDMGVVLIDGGSTLTQDDLSTIRTLYDAGIPASVLLSKSDLLAPEDRLRSLAYVSEQIHSQLGLTLSIHPVSIRASHSSLLEDWLSEVILPLYDRHQQLMQESLRRKIGSLREAVEAALKIRLGRRSPASDGREHARSPIDLDRIDSDLRKAAGRIAETRDLCFEITHRVRTRGDPAMVEAATRLTDAWLSASTSPSNAIVQEALVQDAAEHAGIVFAALKDLARELAKTLQSTSDDLGFKETHNEEDLVSAIKEMPRLDVGALDMSLQPSLLLKVSKNLSIRQSENRLRKQIGPRVVEAFSSFGSMLDAWARRTVSELQLRFETHADGYRAHLARIAAHGQVSKDDEGAISRDLELLGSGRIAKEEMITAP